MQVKVQVVGAENSSPLLLSFPQGVPSHSDDMKLFAGRKQSGRSSKTQITSSVDKVTYKGTDYGEFSTKLDSCAFAVGILDEQSKTLKLHKVEHIFVMKPKVDVVDEPVRVTTMDYSQRRQTLTEEFGSRKKKRALQAEKSNTILTENISGAKSIQNILSVQSPTGDDNTTVTSGSSSKKSKRR